MNKQFLLHININNPRSIPSSGVQYSNVGKPPQPTPQSNPVMTAPIQKKQKTSPRYRVFAPAEGPGTPKL